MIDLNRLGFARFQSHFSALGAPHLVAARVASAHRDAFTLWTASGPRPARIAGRLLGDEDHLVVVGDWVAAVDAGDMHVIEHRLPRISAITRKTAGRTSGVQALAANVDTVFIVTAAGRDLNARRVERFLAIVYESGASPVLVINKCDLDVETNALLAELGASIAGVPVFHTSAETGAGVDALVASLVAGETIAFVGSSGVGKSTLINRIAGGALAATGEIRADDERGRHTTTGRSLYPVRNWVLIDTPGIRELGLVDAEHGLDLVFADIDALSADCRFVDCTHVAEPGCAVQEAVTTGALDVDRLAHYERLGREQQAATARVDVRGRKQAAKRFGKMMREAKDWRQQRRGGG